MTDENSDEEMYCEKHNLKSPAYEDGPDPHCPYCREERRIQQLEQERAARRSDPRMHATVDAPRW
jgi:hypothetical protein